MPIRKDGRYKKPIRWMRQVNRDITLEAVPRELRGGAKAALRIQINRKWTKQKCNHCGGDVWVTARAVHQYGRSWTCKACRDESRLECTLAALAVAERKKAMGIKGGR